MLRAVADGSIPPNEAAERLKRLPFEDLGFARVDHHRPLRSLGPEAVLARGKTPDEVVTIVRALLAEGDTPVLVTKASPEQAEAVRRVAPGATWHRRAGLVVVHTAPEPADPGLVAVVAAGTSDLPVAEEAAATARAFGHRVDMLVDVGVAGVHRILAETGRLQKADVVVVVAGMEGALPSLVTGLVSAPVIAVPTSVGYGAAFDGLAALLGMLNTCAVGMAVVNIDNGFGAGSMAARILAGRTSATEPAEEPADEPTAPVPPPFPEPTAPVPPPLPLPAAEAAPAADKAKDEDQDKNKGGDTEEETTERPVPSRLARLRATADSGKDAGGQHQDQGQRRPSQFGMPRRLRMTESEQDDEPKPERHQRPAAADDDGRPTESEQDTAGERPPAPPPPPPLPRSGPERPGRPERPPPPPGRGEPATATPDWHPQPVGGWPPGQRPAVPDRRDPAAPDPGHAVPASIGDRPPAPGGQYGPDGQGRQGRGVPPPPPPPRRRRPPPPEGRGDRGTPPAPPR
jgi:pyridinium-3,5-biscarboxylic acid mononucleotide synthase